MSSETAPQPQLQVSPPETHEVRSVPLSSPSGYLFLSIGFSIGIGGQKWLISGRSQFARFPETKNHVNVIECSFFVILKMPPINIKK